MPGCARPAPHGLLGMGRPGEPNVVVCAHGVSRQGRDFDVLARSLSRHRRVVCPDVVGRGRSDRLADPAGYQMPTYLADMVTLLARLDAGRLDWVGTSMGGLIGLTLAALPGSPIGAAGRQRCRPDARVRGGAAHRRLSRPADALGERRRGGRLPAHDLGRLRAADARRMAGAVAPDAGARARRRRRGAALRPGHRAAFQGAHAGVCEGRRGALWWMWEAVRCPVLLLRGAESDLLSRATAEAMLQRGPRYGCMSSRASAMRRRWCRRRQRAVVEEFLLGP